MICPDCRRGDHGMCGGDTWDNDRDRAVICECWQWQHEPLFAEEEQRP